MLKEVINLREPLMTGSGSCPWVVCWELSLWGSSEDNIYLSDISGLMHVWRCEEAVFCCCKPSNTIILAQRMGGLLVPAPCLVCSGRRGKERP